MKTVLLILTFALIEPTQHQRPDFMIYILNDSIVAVNHHFEWIDTIPINDIEDYIKWESNIK